MTDKGKMASGTVRRGNPYMPDTLEAKHQYDCPNCDLLLLVDEFGCGNEAKCQYTGLLMPVSNEALRIINTRNLIHGRPLQGMFQLNKEK